MTFNEVITNLGYFFLAINTIVFTISYYNNKEKALKYFNLYLVLCLIVQFYSSYLSSLNIHNLFLTHFFFIGQLIFLGLFFTIINDFKKNKNLNKFLIFSIAGSFIIYLSISPKAFVKWNTLEVIVTSLPLLIYSFYFFIKKIDANKSKKYIYFNSGFFVYTLCSTLIFTLGNIGAKEIKLYVWSFNSLLYLLFQITIFIEWYKNFRKPIN